MQNRVLVKKRRFRLVPQLDQYPWLVRFVQTLIGKAVLLAMFSGLLCLFWPRWVPYITTCLLFCIFLPKQRHIILVIASLASVYIIRTKLQWGLIVELARSYDLSGPLLTKPGAVLSVGLIFLCCFMLVHFSRVRGSAFRIRRPVLTVISSYLILACLISYAPFPAVIKFGLWVFLILFGKYIWFLCYSLTDCNVPDSPSFAEQLGHYIPFWYVSTLPYHRGATNLRRIKATTPTELAICQLKGLKLLIWATCLLLFSLFYYVVCHSYAEGMSGMISISLRDGSLYFSFKNKLIYTLSSWPLFLDIPPYEYALDEFAAGRPLALHWNWLALIGRFFIQIVDLAIITHAGIAICRMAGYNALRNVYRPFQAVSLIDFWNRNFYYYKELLVTVFFYPTFLRYFKKRPILRFYAATMAAAGFGNFLYHFLVDLGPIISKGFFATLLSMHSLIFYCFVLGNALFVSQWRKLKGGRYAWSPPQPFASIFVLGFYCILNIFGYKMSSWTLNFKFLLSLFNISAGGNG